MKARLTVLCAFLFAALLLMYPKEALAAAVQAMGVWATSFAPSLFPFFVIVPALSCPEALRLYEKLFGKAMPALFGCPGSAAAAVAIGWIAGSPAGALAVGRVARAEKMPIAQMRRAALLTVGVSPMFLAAAVGAGLLGSPGLGTILIRSQIGAMLLSGLIFKYCWRKDQWSVFEQDPNAAAAGRGDTSMRAAVLQMLTVCGWMVLFTVIARLTAIVLPFEGLEAPLLAVLEVSSGCAAIAKLPLDPTTKLVCIAATCCFGGLSILMQSMQILKSCAVRWHHLLGAKALQAVLGALLCDLQTRFFVPDAVAAFSYGGAAQASFALAAAVALCVACGVWMLRPGAPRKTRG